MAIRYDFDAVLPTVVTSDSAMIIFQNTEIYSFCPVSVKRVGEMLLMKKLEVKKLNLKYCTCFFSFLNRDGLSLDA